MKRLIVTLLLATLSTGVYAKKECKTDLAAILGDLKETMRTISRVAHSDDSEALATEVDTAVGLVHQAREQEPLVYAELSGDELDEAKQYFADGMSDLETLLLSLKQADADAVDGILADIKSLRKKSHKKLKKC